MIYAESLRHFAQEWIQIQHPAHFDVTSWPWDPERRLYIVNLYCVSATQEMTIDTKPQPMVSILVNDLPDTKPLIISETEAVYKGYFEKDTFKLPRRYLYNPLNSKAERNLRPTRFDFTSNGYGKMASDWKLQDLQFLKLLGSRRHVRRTIYDDPLYSAIRSRLNELSRAAGCSHIAMADNLLDATMEAVLSPRCSPETFLIQVPTTGLIQPIKKSKDYSLIHGVFMKCAEDCMMAIADEPCYEEYMDALVPFSSTLMKSAPAATLRANNTNSIIYMVVECPKLYFHFQEYFPADKLRSNEMPYARALIHSFNLEPETASNSYNSEIVVRLRHHIRESLVPDTKENKILLTKRGVKLFHRSDIPDGIKRTATGEITTTL